MELCRWYLFVALLFPLQWPVARSRVNLTLDLAVIYVSQFGPSQIPKYKECTGVLAESFVLHESLTRIAVVARNGTIYGWKLFTPGLTSDAAELNASTQTMVVLPQTSENSKMGTALKIVGEELKFAEPVSGRTRFIVMTIGAEIIEDGADEYAKMLREHGVGIYVLAQGAKEAEMLKLTGNHTNMYLSGWIDGDLCPLFRRLTNITTSHACQYENACFYTDQKTCANSSWTPRIPTVVFDCAANGYPMPSPAGGSCPQEQCDYTCNKYWPLEKDPPSCTDETCGKQLNTRIGPMQWKQLEHCPLQYKQCPACPTKADQSNEGGLPGWAIALVVLAVLVVIGGTAGGVVFMTKKNPGKAAGKSAGKGTVAGKGKAATEGIKKEAAAASDREKIKSVTAPVAAKGKGKK